MGAAARQNQRAFKHGAIDGKAHLGQQLVVQFGTIGIATARFAMTAEACEP
jgi:hypothetical protein